MKRCFALVSVSILAAGLFVGTTPTQADETYIPRGHSYGPGQDFLPPLNSEEDRVNAMADAREVELQREYREQRAFQEQFNMMIDLHQYRPGRSYAPY